MKLGARKKRGLTFIFPVSFSGLKQKEIKSRKGYSRKSIRYCRYEIQPKGDRDIRKEDEEGVEIKLGEVCRGNMQVYK